MPQSTFDSSEYDRRIDETKARMRAKEVDALGVAEPGVACERVDRAWRDVIGKYDIEKEERIGYSIGLG